MMNPDFQESPQFCFINSYKRYINLLWQFLIGQKLKIKHLANLVVTVQSVILPILQVKYAFKNILLNPGMLQF